LATKPDTIAEQRHGWSIPEWGALYGFKRAKSYTVIWSGAGPRTVLVNGHQIITVEADEAWRKSLPTAPRKPEPVEAGAGP
jgi:hypothetical protein